MDENTISDQQVSKYENKVVSKGQKCYWARNTVDNGLLIRSHPLPPRRYSRSSFSASRLSAGAAISGPGSTHTSTLAASGSQHSATRAEP